MKQTIKEIESTLRTISDDEDPFIKKCLLDERKGVQELIKRWKKKQEIQFAEKERLRKMMQYENEARKQGYQLIAGIDEVGRGPLAGPVVAAAVILPNDAYLPGVNDSKKLSIKRREELYKVIIEKAVAVGIGLISAEDIDELNIYQATKKAMLGAIQQLNLLPDYLLIDAMKLDVPVSQQSIIKGDSLSISIASASIVAKVYRDRLMVEYSKKYPQYQFERNMGYGTSEHLQAIRTYGPTPIHRKSFSPIREMIKNNQ